MDPKDIGISVFAKKKDRMKWKETLGVIRRVSDVAVFSNRWEIFVRLFLSILSPSISSNFSFSFFARTLFFVLTNLRNESFMSTEEIYRNVWRLIKSSVYITVSRLNVSRPNWWQRSNECWPCSAACTIPCTLVILLVLLYIYKQHAIHRVSFATTLG